MRSGASQRAEHTDHPDGDVLAQLAQKGLGFRRNGLARFRERTVDVKEDDGRVG